MNSKVFVTGIGTDVGKTVVSAILCEAFKLDYWKPIQAGDLDDGDKHKIQAYCSSPRIHPEGYRLTQPMSPHAASKRDGISISLDKIILPQTENNLLIEGAGGWMVPMNDEGDTFADFAKSNSLPTILVSRHYLGSINHTLLTLESMRLRGIDLLGVIFVGEENTETESIILSTAETVSLGRIPICPEVNEAFVRDQAEILKENTILKAHFSHDK
ncbi:MAG: dethiobiotin synthetase [Psychromonas sp.]|jgi:dethiobiotin synthetase